MNKLNLSLWASMLAALIVIATAVAPITRPFMHRIGEMMGPTDDSKNNFNRWPPTPNNIDAAELQAVEFLRQNQGQYSVESAESLRDLGIRMKSAPICGFAIREAGRANLYFDTPRHLPALLRIREAAGSIEADAAKQGLRLDPENAFFVLADAISFARRQDQKGMAAALDRVNQAKRFDDYTFDILRIETEELKRRRDQPTNIEIGEAMSSITYPHVSNYLELPNAVARIEDPRRRMTALFKLAIAAKLMQTSPEVRINDLVGHSMLAKTVHRAANLTIPKKWKKDDVLSAIVKADAEAGRLGVALPNGGWSSLKSVASDPVRQTASYGDFDFDISRAGTVGLLLLGIVGAIALAFGLVSALEPNLQTFAGIVVGIQVAQIIVYPNVPIGPSLIALNLIWFGFLGMRLPGKEKMSWAVSTVGAAIFLWTSSDTGSGPQGAISMLGIVAIPFIVSIGIKTPISAWVARALTFFVAFGLVFLGVRSSQFSANFSELNISESIRWIVVVLLTAVPWIAAMLMALEKSPLPNVAKRLMEPLPFLALALACYFASGVFQIKQVDDRWKAVIAEEAPERFRAIL